MVSLSSTAVRISRAPPQNQLMMMIRESKQTTLTLLTVSVSFTVLRIFRPHLALTSTNCPTIASVKTAAIMEDNRDSGPAPRYDAEAAVALLKKHGFSLRSRTPLPPLLLAARENRPDEIKRLIEEGTSVNVRGGCGRTALHVAAIYGNPGMQFNRHSGSRV